MKTFRIFLLSVMLASTTSTALASVVKLYGGDKFSRGISIQQSKDGGFVITGYTSFIGNGEEDVLLLKADAAGDVQWMKTYGGPHSDNGWAVLPTDDSGYIITGFTESLGAGGYDVYVIKTDTAGNALWEKTFGGTGDDRSWDLDRAKGGGYIIVGETASAGKGERDALVLKIDDQGNMLWQKTYGGAKTIAAFLSKQPMTVARSSPESPTASVPETVTPTSLRRTLKEKSGGVRPSEAKRRMSRTRSEAPRMEVSSSPDTTLVLPRAKTMSISSS